MNASPAARRTGRSVLARNSWLTLGVSALLAAGLLAGDLWWTRAAALVVFLGGLTATAMAWRELRKQRAGFEQRAAVELRAQGEKLHTEREHHVRLLRILQDRNDQLRSHVGELRTEAGRLTQEAARVRGDNASLALDNATLAQDNANLLRDNASLRIEVSRLNEVHNAEILALPRRVSGALSAGEQILWSEENQPTVVDLLAITAPFEDESRRDLA